MKHSLSLKFACMLAFIVFPFNSFADDYPVSGLKLVTDASAISSEKNYAVVATGSDGEKYAMLVQADQKSGKLTAQKLESSGVLPTSSVCTVNRKSSGKCEIKCGKTTLYNGGNLSNTLYTNPSSKRSSTFYLYSQDGGLIMSCTSKESTSYFIGISSDHKYFKIYTDRSMAAAYLYECTMDAAEPEASGTISISTAEGYGTYYTDKAYVMPDGLKGAVVSGVDGGTLSLQLNWMFKAGDVVPAGTALLVYGANGDYEVKAPQTSATLAVDATDVENLLLGTLTEQETTAPAGASAADYKFYKMYYSTDAATSQQTLGFYWGEPSGGVFTNAAHRAYLALPKEKALSTQAAQGFALPVTPETGIRQIVSDGNPSVNATTSVYTLSGHKVPHASQRGVYIVNGKKVINR